MKGKYLVPFSFLILSGLYTFSQYGNVTGRKSNANFEANLAANNVLRGRDVLQEVLGKKNKYPIPLSKINGNPYYNEKFLIANLYYKDSLELGQFFIRYNAYSDEMEVNNGQGIKVLNKAHFLTVNISNQKYILVKDLSHKTKNNLEYYIEKTKGPKCSLYLKYCKKFEPGKEAKTSFHKPILPKFKEVKTYYLRFEKESLIELKFKKKKLVRSFPDKTKLLRAYLESQNLEIKSEDDLITIVDYYNTLD